MNDDIRSEWCARIGKPLKSLRPEDRERLFAMIDAAAELLRSDTPGDSATLEDNMEGGSGKPACYFSGVLSEDGARLKPHDRDECRETLDLLTAVERRFYSKRLGMDDDATTSAGV